MEQFQLNDENTCNKMAKKEIYFPIDVMTNILNRLPSASIVRFQTVSKYWCHVIRSDTLIARSKSSLMSVQLSTNAFGGNFTTFNFGVDGKTNTESHKINLKGTLNYNLSNMVNGLACVYGRKSSTNFYLMNLTTFEKSNYSKRKIKGVRYDHITLGFDPSTGLYKFIRIYSHNKTSSYHCEILEVGVLFKGDWKIIGKIPDKVDIDHPVFSNGAIYWRKDPLLNESKSLAFDLQKLNMKEEKFEMVTTVVQNEVENHHSDWIYDFTLSEENGRLYMLHYCCERKHLYGWRLKEKKGEKGVWNVLFQVDFAPMAEKEPSCLLGLAPNPCVVGIVDGKVLIGRMYKDKGVYIYDLVHKKLSTHWDVYCGSFFYEQGERLLFYRRGGNF